MNIVGLLRTILIIVVVYYVVTFINRYFLNKYVKRVQKLRAEQEARKRKAREGKVIIDYQDKKKKKINGDVGEYVDYEEIKDKKNT